jgi:catechol 2,3-dioxygenase-like lactoylglutathione lyase family enzyme
MTMTRLGACIIYVPEVAATVAFYERAFGMKRRFVSEKQEYGELEGDAPLAFAQESFVRSNGLEFQPARKEAPAPPFEVVLVYDDVAAAVGRAVEAGAKLVSEPKQKPWGQTVAYVKDPNGVLVELCTPWSAPA